MIPGNVDFAVTVDANVPAGFTLVSNTATITDDGTNGPDEDPTDNSAGDTTPVDSFVDLVLTVDDGIGTTTPGNSHVYVVDFQNVGDIDATGVIITQTLPVGTTFDPTNSSSGWVETSPGSGVYQLSVGSLPAGGMGSVNFAVTVDDPAAAGLDTIVDNASITDDGASGADPTPANNVDDDIDTLIAAPDLFVMKDDGQSVVAAGDSISYTINYGNGGSQGATGVLLTETLPAGVAFDAANSTAGWIETSPGSGVFNLAIGNLASGQMGSATFAVVVDDPLAAGIDQLVNDVQIMDDGTNGADEDPTDNQDSDTDTVDAAPDLIISKMTAEPQQRPAAPSFTRSISLMWARKMPRESSLLKRCRRIRHSTRRQVRLVGPRRRRGAAFSNSMWGRSHPVLPARSILPSP